MEALTERDVDIIFDVYKHRYLKTSQIQQLHFPSERTTTRRLKFLTDYKLLKHFNVPNIPERIYQVSSRGANLVAQHKGAAVADLLWSRTTAAPKDYYFMQHFLAINDFRIQTTEACQKSDIHLSFIPEYYGHKHPSGRITKHIKDFVFGLDNPAEKISHTPDAVFALSKAAAASPGGALGGSSSALFFLEIDRGTEVLSDPDKGFLKMIRYYLSYAKSAKFKSYQEEFRGCQFRNFRLLIVTSSEQRLDNMRQTISSRMEMASPVLRFFLVTTFDKIETETFWQPIWQSLDTADTASYAIG